MFFLGITIFGAVLVFTKSGNHDADFMIKLFGYLLLMPGIICFIQMLL